MSIMIATITLFAMIMVDEAEAASNDERLAKMFSPILILTEDTEERYGEILVIKPEPVEIVGAGSAANIWIFGKALRRNKCCTF